MSDQRVVEMTSERANAALGTDSQAPMTDFLSIQNVGKTYERSVRRVRERLQVLDQITWSARRREVVTIIGPSGCGKSTLLNCIAGLSTYDEGEITLDGARISEPGVDRAVVFQHASLLPWRTVAHNVAYGLELRREVGRTEIRTRVARALELVGLTGFEHHFPHQISGGMQQRVNLARALVVEPKLILMDEPYGALDALTKETLQDELAALIEQIQGTTVFVTHDINEAVYLADKVLVLSPRPGRIVAAIPVDLPRPRVREMTLTAEFRATADGLRSLLRTTPEPAPPARAD